MYMYNFVYKNDYVLYIYSKVIFLGNAVFTSFSGIFIRTSFFGVPLSGTRIPKRGLSKDFSRCF